MEGMFDGATALSDVNKCTIHRSFIIYDIWPTAFTQYVYDWSDICTGQPD